MIYSKQALSYAEQADLLLSRGLIADRSLLIERLKAVNYYRLSGYLHTFRKIDTDGQRIDLYLPGTNLTTVWRRYVFDRQLRLLVLDGIERVEIAMKTRLTHDFCRKYGAFGYLEPQNLPRLAPVHHADFLRRVEEETSRSREDFVGHFLSKYGDSHEYLPLWMAVEVMSYGSVLTLFHGMAESELKHVARGFGLKLPLLDSWITTLNYIRNICAHHGRLWNRELGVKPKIPYSNIYPEWHNPVPTPADRIFSVLTILHFFIAKIAPQSKWPERLRELLAEFPDMPLEFMGFPEEWNRHTIWNYHA
jgi:abortive infection bacteriophage resistance protein